MIGPNNRIDSNRLVLNNPPNDSLDNSQNTSTLSSRTVQMSPDIINASSNFKTASSYEIYNEKSYKGFDESRYEGVNLEEKFQLVNSSLTVVGKVKNSLEDSSENSSIPFESVFDLDDQDDQYDRYSGIAIEKEVSNEKIQETNHIENEKTTENSFITTEKSFINKENTRLVKTELLVIRKSTTIKVQVDEQTILVIEQFKTIISTVMETIGIEPDHEVMNSLVEERIPKLGRNPSLEQKYKVIREVVQDLQNTGALKRDGKPINEEEFKEVVKELRKTFKEYYRTYKPTIEENKPAQVQEQAKTESTKSKINERKEKRTEERQQTVAGLCASFIMHLEIMSQINKKGEEKAKEEKLEQQQQNIQDDIKLTERHQTILKELINAQEIKISETKQVAVPVKTLIKTRKLVRKIYTTNKSTDIKLDFDYAVSHKLKPLLRKTAGAA